MRRQTEGAALYRVQRRGRAVVRSVRSREWRASWNEKPRGCGVWSHRMLRRYSSSFLYFVCD